MNNSTASRSWLARIFRTPEERRLRSGFRLLGQLVLMVICIAILSGCSLFFLPFLLGSADARWLLLSQASMVIAVTVSVYLARRWLDRRSFSSLGLRWSMLAFRDLLAGFLIAALVMGFIYLVEWAAGWLTVEGYAWQTESAVEVVLEVGAMMLVFLAGSWQEELLHRGYWLQNLEEGLNLFWAILLSSIFFSLTHLGNPHFSPAAVLGIFSGGIFLAYGYIRTRQLWLPLGLHTGWNFFEGTVLGFPVSGLTGMPGIIQQTVDGPVRITGGLFGPEAGLVLLPALLLGALLVNIYTRSRDTQTTPTI